MRRNVSLLTFAWYLSGERAEAVTVVPAGSR